MSQQRVMTQEVFEEKHPIVGGALFGVKALRKRCDCEKCLSGEATTHNDESHDQSLDQTIKFAHPSDPKQSFQLHMLGGTTKCARVFAQYLFDQHVQHPGCFYQKKILEIGAGTGLVGMTLARLGAYVVFTDQASVLELLRSNIEENIDELDKGRPVDADEDQFRDDAKEDEWIPTFIPHTQIVELHWGDASDERGVKAALVPYVPVGTGAVPGYDIVIGSDLIYAHENIAPLVSTFETFAGNEAFIASLPPAVVQADTSLVTNASTSSSSEASVAAAADAPQTLTAPPAGTAADADAPTKPWALRRAYLAAIDRFNWEKNYYKGMSRAFDTGFTVEQGDIKIFGFDARTR